MNYEHKEVIVFDLDNTLAWSKQPLAQDMAQELKKLLVERKVGVMSGAGLAQYKTQFLSQLAPQTNQANLYLLPTSGAALYRYDTTWHKVYEEKLSNQEMDHVAQTLESVLKTLEFDFSQKHWGAFIEKRDTQVSFSGLGQSAPLEKKEAWDPKQEKRKKIVAKLIPLLPEYSVRIGGTTTIDINKKGIDKAYGIQKLAAHLAVPIPRMLYVGDALYPGGNDEAVLPTGIDTMAVKNPDDTKKLIEKIAAIPLQKKSE